MSGGIEARWGRGSGEEEVVRQNEEQYGESDRRTDMKAKLLHRYNVLNGVEGSWVVRCRYNDAHRLPMVSLSAEARDLFWYGYTYDHRYGANKNYKKY